MASVAEQTALGVFQLAAERVPAYRSLLAEANINPADIRTIENFHRLPVLDKKCTFSRFPIEQLCLDGSLGRLASVLTSSGHSGLFAFGLSDPAHAAAAADSIDEGLDLVFGVRACPTLLINCLPMGVKVPTRVCTLAETSVRPDMVVALVKTFGSHFGQMILVGDAAFVKLALELGRGSGLDWSRHRVHVVLGEEILAENARRYIQRLLGRGGSDPAGNSGGLVVSSMGIGEVGLNLFFEAPPATALIRLRGVLHDDADLRQAVLGHNACHRLPPYTPSLFTYDPRRILVEFLEDARLVLTTLDASQRIPLVRYAAGDRGQFVHLPAGTQNPLRAAGCDVDLLGQMPIVAIYGRGQHILAGQHRVYPESVKEGIYHDPELATLTTANFRLTGGKTHATVRVQLSSGVAQSDGLNRRFAESIARYTSVPTQVTCQPFAAFGSGMNVDYERKLDYLGA